ncbi:MAG: hypothetical protein CM15mP125_3470 [Gammaproteobacteria bacterium]|nr:MAG: hypothetical protein CM15mP125_3470 [Gammaproteobacteria bacterium]
MHRMDNIFITLGPDGGDWSEIVISAFREWMAPFLNGPLVGVSGIAKVKTGFR